MTWETLKLVSNEKWENDARDRNRTIPYMSIKTTDTDSMLIRKYAYFWAYIKFTRTLV